MRIPRWTMFVTVAAAVSVAPAYAQSHGHAPIPTIKTTTPSTATTTPTPTSTSTTTTHVSPIAAKIASHPPLASKCTALLPKGTTLNQAATGFRNQGQFIAALHVSKNLNIPFADLKKAMTGPHAMSLGQAIHHLRPSIDSDAAATHATSQASTDVKTTTATTSTTAATSTRQ